MYRLFFISALFLAFNAQAHLTDHSDVNDKLNKTYQRFSQAFSQLDTELVKDVYAEDACYIPAGQQKEITRGRSKIISMYQDFFGRIRLKNARIEVDFRVVERQIDGNSATDIGYYLIRFHPAKETEQPISEFAGKFVTVSKQNNEGKWHLTVDTNIKAEPSFYYDAQPSSELYFGQQFTSIAKK